MKLIKVIRKMLGMSYKEVCRSLRVAHSTFMRWKERMKKGEPMVKRPGPRKEAPLELKGLMDRIRRLSHKRKRSHGVGLLFEEYNGEISRRDFNCLVRLTRADLNRERAAWMRRIVWLQPGLVWGMDDSEYGVDAEYKKLYLHSVRDLPSKYQFDPLGGDFAKGPRVEENLKLLFDLYGAPLFVKRDQGPNLAHTAVEDLLGEYMVIPLVSPVGYPPYNGGIERSQYEIQSKIEANLPEGEPIQRQHFHVYGQVAAYELNHIPRRSLKGRTPCEVFFSEKRGARFSKRKRCEIFEWIKKLACEIMAELGKSTKPAVQAAWRMAVETWLQLNGHIKVSRGGKVSPYFLPLESH
ncbi:MAG: hypothetical protein SVR04_16325 [Spirochaetota bacterium]|nr:hypothetical protein [Spirochaetota bacterium]